MKRKWHHCNNSDQKIILYLMIIQLEYGDVNMDFLVTEKAKF